MRITHTEPGTNAELVDYDNGNIGGNTSATKGVLNQVAAIDGGVAIDGRIGAK